MIVPLRGVGVLIAVRSTFTSDELLFVKSRNLEFIYVKLSFSDRSVYITCLYTPPSCEFLEYLNHLSVIQSVSSRLNRDQLVVQGYFNVPFHIAQRDFIDGSLDLSLSQANFFESLLVDYWIYVL